MIIDILEISREVLQNLNHLLDKMFMKKKGHFLPTETTSNFTEVSFPKGALVSKLPLKRRQ